MEATEDSPAIKAIETVAYGCRFRSRLEARYAVFFTELGLKWEYEQEGYNLLDLGCYLPDFVLPEIRTIVEVKGVDDPQAQKKIEALCGKTGLLDDHWGHVLTGIDALRLGVSHNCAKPEVEWVNPFDANQQCLCGKNKTPWPAKADMPIHNWGQDAVIRGSKWTITCPFCDMDYAHKVFNKNGVDKEEFNRVVYALECGTYVAIDFDYSKGVTSLSAQFTSSCFYCVYQPPLSALYQSDKARWNQSYAKAKQARFEHGEAPV